MLERIPSNGSRAHEHLFYSCLALAYAFTVFVGFSRTYYLKQFFGTPPLTWVFNCGGC